ncbi:MAG: bifunctional tRNA (5-methylaminomethyl-2-thiouridine)(34)-methyltransferase MnmD/FAD-dependent 5-carboxymethylaminomethyl-2-thiouridine(34) oxidoreductase MnmC [Parvularculaceae bacterium]
MSGEAETGRIASARVDWTGGAPVSVDFGDVYFSGDGAAEADHVFLAGNTLAARFATAGAFVIGELGFGTGLNFLKAAALWRATPKPDGARLVYFSVEQFPFSADDLARAHAAWPALSELSARVRALMPPLVAGLHRLAITSDISLILGLGEAGGILNGAEGAIDAWFFDGFAPAKNPDMWRPELFVDCARLSKPGATFATFTVAGDVRRALQAAGFAVEKRSGFARKKEMLAGRIETPPKKTSGRAPWFETANARPLAAGARVAIVGGGIAGASLAFEARRAGLAPTIIEAETLASGASGNPAGLIMPRLDLGRGAAAQFFLTAYLHTIRLLGEFGGNFFRPCGVLLGAPDDEERVRQARIVAERLLPSDWMEARPDGLYLPQAGVVDPRKFTAALAAETTLTKARAVAIEHGSDGVALRLNDGSRHAFDAVILANGVEALDFLEARTLPLAAVAGQIDWFPDAAAPEHALVFGPYAAPGPEPNTDRGGLVIGATYERPAAGQRVTPSRASTEENIKAIAAFAPRIAATLDRDAAHSRVAIRCQTPDRLPVAGPLPDLGFYGAVYDDLRLGRQRDYPPGEMIPGVFILSGLGSRGLVTAPLAAAMIVAAMTGAPSPVSADIAVALHPARFFIRDLKRAQSIRKG